MSYISCTNSVNGTTVAVLKVVSHLVVQLKISVCHGSANVFQCLRLYLSITPLIKLCFHTTKFSVCVCVCVCLFLWTKRWSTICFPPTWLWEKCLSATSSSVQVNTQCKPCWTISVPSNKRLRSLTPTCSATSSPWLPGPSRVVPTTSTVPSGKWIMRSKCLCGQIKKKKNLVLQFGQENQLFSFLPHSKQHLIFNLATTFDFGHHIA